MSTRRIAIMIDVVFSDSACGNLKVAQHYGEGKYRDGCIGVFVSHADGSKPTKEEVETARREAKVKARLAWESSTPLGGKTADIYGFNLVLSVGDVSENQLGMKRKQTLEQLYSVYPHEEGHRAAEEIFERAEKDLNAIRERAEAGEAIRIWYSNLPDEMCGLYWFLEQLNQWSVHDVQISSVKLPEWEVDEKGNIVRKNGWGEVAPGEWNRYLSLQEPVLSAYVLSCATHWKELQMENTPLRATLNGQLTSMTETLYDNVILREIAVEDEEFHEARVIGRVLGKYRLGIGDFWVAFRIEEFIREGILMTVTASAKDMPIYHRVLKKCANAL